MALETLLTFWPPDPWARMAVNSSSSSSSDTVADRLITPLSRSALPCAPQGYRSSVPTGHSSTDKPGECRVIPRCPGLVGDSAPTLQFLQLQARHHPAHVVDIGRQISGQQQPIVQRQALDDLLHHREDDGCAVAGDRMVEAWMLGQLVGLHHKGAEQFPGVRRAEVDPVQPQVLVAHVAAYPHHVPLVRGDDTQLELLEEAADLGKALVLFPADLHGKGHMLAVIKTEGHQHMGDAG